MAYWLLKSEPHTWSWSNQVRDHRAPWDGVRNYQARNFMQQMDQGDLALFYHSVTEKSIVGIVRVVRTYYADPQDPRFGIVDVEALVSLPRPVTLDWVRQEAALATLGLVVQPRLSVMPVSPQAWHVILAQGGLDAATAIEEGQSARG